MADPANWSDIHSSVGSLRELLDACYAALGAESGNGKVSSSTKKRLEARAVNGLNSGKELIKVLSANLQQLQQSSQQWECNVVQASKSHKDLMQQLELTSDELHSTRDKLRQAEADRLAVSRETEQLRQQLAAAMADKQALSATISQLESELQSAAFGANEANCHLSELQAQMEQLAAATRSAEEVAAAAAGALQAAQQEAANERAARLRHEDAVARLTADNLVFMAKLRAAEATAASATAERDELVLALEEHKGPWMDEVHQGVEKRVKEALARAEQLEAQQEQTAQQTAQQVAQLAQQQADLEAQLEQAAQVEQQLRQELQAAQAAAAEARAAAEEASMLAAEAQATADARAAELRVAQGSLRTMREECNERWMSERSARAQLAELQSQLADGEAERSKLKAELLSRADELTTQRAVNQQLMLKKEEVEWQLMAAIAKLNAEQQSQRSGSPMSGMTSPLSPHMVACQQQPFTSTGGQLAFSSSATTCDAVAALLAPQQQQQQHQGVAGSSAGAGDVGGAAALQACWSAETGKSPFSVLLSQPFDGASPKQATAGSAGGAAAAAGGSAQGQGFGQVPEDNSSSVQQQQQQSNPSAAAGYRPSAFLAAAAAAATAASGGSCLAGGAAHGVAGGGSGVGCGISAASSLPLPCVPCASSGSVPDMFTLPSLSYGLATLPPPELLAAAAGGSGMSAAAGGALSIAIARSGSIGLAASGSGSLGGCCGSVLSPRGSLQGCKGVVVGATGGLMAPFSPLPRAPSNSLPSIGMGAIFPESLTASAVTDSDQLGSRCFSLPPNLLQHMQQRQQQQWPGQKQQQQSQQQAGIHQLLAQQQGPSRVEQQQLKQVQLPRQQQQQSVSVVQPESSQPASTGAKVCSGPAAVVGAPQVRRPIMHPAFATHTGGSPLSSSPVDAAPAGAACSPQCSSSTSTSSSSRDVPDPHQGHHQQQQQQQQQYGTSVLPHNASHGSGISTHLGGSSSQLHGILLNGPHGRPRSPAPAGTGTGGTGPSPSGSMKSVRFSFENLDQNLNPAEPEPQQVLSDKEGLPDQLLGMVGRGLGKDQGPQGVELGMDGAGSARRTGGATAAAGFACPHAAGTWDGPASVPLSPLSHPSSAAGYGYGGSVESSLPARVRGGRGAAAGSAARSYEEEARMSDMFFSIRAGQSSLGGSEGSSNSSSSYSLRKQQHRLLQQHQQQQAKAAAAARAAHAAGAMVNLPLPKGPPVHPVLGAMGWGSPPTAGSTARAGAGSSSSSSSQAT